MTSLRGRGPRADRSSVTGSPPVRVARRSVRRRSTIPRSARLRRRLGRWGHRGEAASIHASTHRRSASSSRSNGTSDNARSLEGDGTRTAGRIRSGPSVPSPPRCGRSQGTGPPPGLRASASGALSGRVPAGVACATGTRPGGTECPPGTWAKTRSNVTMSSWCETRHVRASQYSSFGSRGRSSTRARPSRMALAVEQVTPAARSRSTRAAHSQARSGAGTSVTASEPTDSPRDAPP